MADCPRYILQLTHDGEANPMIIGKVFGSNKGNRHHFAIRDTGAHVSVMIKICHAVSIRTNAVIIQVASMNTPLLICSEQTHRDKVFHGRQRAIRVCAIISLLRL